MASAVDCHAALEVAAAQSKNAFAITWRLTTALSQGNTAQLAHSQLSCSASAAAGAAAQSENELTED